jgi:membrane associated rhomboid family serine protease
VAATFAQLAVMPNSNIPNLGASGAIAGVLAAYVVLYPRGRVTPKITPSIPT